MTATYRIAKWMERFENNRTRTIKHMRWVPIPNDHDGEGFGTIMEHEDSATIYGVWVILVQLASKSTDRGTLAKSDGTPLNIRSISVRTRLRESDIEKSLPTLIEIGWLEVIEVEELTEEVTHPSRTQVPESRTQVTIEGKGIEGNGTEGKGNTLGQTDVRPNASAYSAKFEEFWLAYPKKKSKGDAWKAWKIAVRSTSDSQIIRSCELYRDSDEGRGEFVPHAGKWIRASRWEDDPGAWKDTRSQQTQLPRSQRPIVKLPVPAEEAAQ